MNKVLTRNAVIRAITDEMKDNRTVEFVISTEAVDKHRTVFRRDGWQLDEYQRNPIVMYNHAMMSDDPDTIIGTSEVFFDGDDMIGRVMFEPSDINPLAEKIFRKVLAGTLKMASIGAIPSEGHFGKKDRGENPDVLYFTKQTLTEWSIVPVGSNPDAHKRNNDGVQEWKQKLVNDIDVQVDQVNNERNVFDAQININKNKFI